MSMKQQSGRQCFEEGSDCADRRSRSAQVRTVSCSRKHGQTAARYLRVDKLAYGTRRDGIAGTLNDQAGNPDAGQVGSIVGQEGDAGKVLGDLRVRAAEAVLELLAELGALGISHDERRHAAGPAEVVGIQKVEQSVD